LEGKLAEGKLGKLLRILKGLPDDDASVLLEALDQDSGVEKTESEVGLIDIAKADEDKQLIFGWANLTIDKHGKYVEDTQGDQIDVESLEENVYLFNLLSREGDEDHTEDVKMHLVESVMITPEKVEAMAKRRAGAGFETDAEILENLQKALPNTAWWTGWYIPDPAVFRKVTSGEYPQLSIGGLGVREPILAAT
jgi:hypothetical protein